MESRICVRFVRKDCGDFLSKWTDFLFLPGQVKPVKGHKKSQCFRHFPVPESNPFTPILFRKAPFDVEELEITL